jgi:hypothetical protein
MAPPKQANAGKKGKG